MLFGGFELGMRKIPRYIMAKLNRESRIHYIFCITKILVTFVGHLSSVLDHEYFLGKEKGLEGGRRLKEFQLPEWTLNWYNISSHFTNIAPSKCDINRV